MNAWRGAQEVSPIQRELPSDPIEALQAVRALMGELDEKAETDDAQGFDQAIIMLFGDEIAQQVGIENVKPGGPENLERGMKLIKEKHGDGEVKEAPGGDLMLMSLDTLRNTARCTAAEHRRYAIRLSLGHRRDVALFIKSRKPIPAGTFGEVADPESQKLADWALGRK